ncbi:MAG: VOC family protein [Chloroflexi bacterium]|nr:VOC family protein [Chloroflexota bacterium]
MITRIKYFSVAVRDLAEGIITYQKRFGLVQAAPLGDTRWGFRNTMMGDGVNNMIEIISPNGPNAALSRYMDERAHPELNPKGEGPYLVGVEVEDLEAAVARIEANGGKVTREPESPNLAWPHPTSTCMTFFELHAPAPAPEGTPNPGPTIRGIRQFTIAVKDLEASIETMTKRLGLEQIGEIGAMPYGFRRVSLGYNGKTVIQLNSPHDENSSMARLMRQRSNPRNPNGEGLYQLIVGVDDVSAVADKVAESGGRVNRNPNFGSVAWPHPVDTHMVLMELQNVE